MQRNDSSHSPPTIISYSHAPLTFMQELEALIVDFERTQATPKNYDAALLDEMFSDDLEDLFQRILKDDIGIIEETYTPLSQYSEEFNLSPTIMRSIIQDAQPHLVDISALLRLLYKEEIATEVNVLSLMILAKDTGYINKSYAALRTCTEASPSEVFNTIMVAAPYIRAVYNMMSWLPQTARTLENVDAIFKNARYAENWLAVCILELELINTPNDADFNLLFLRNKSLGVALDPLRKIYDYINSNQIKDLKLIHYIQREAQENPNILYEITHLIESSQIETTAAEHLRSAAITALQNKKNWLAHVARFNEGLIIDDRTSATVSTFSFTDTMHSSESLYDTDNSLTPPHSNLSQESTASKPYPQEFITNLEATQYHIPFCYVTDVIKAYDILFEASSMKNTLVERHYAYAVAMAKAIVTLEYYSFDHKYFDLLEQRPDLAEEIAAILIKLDSTGKFNNIDFILLRNKLDHAYAIANLLNNTDPTNYRKCIASTLHQTQIHLPLHLQITIGDEDDKNSESDDGITPYSTKPLITPSNSAFSFLSTSRSSTNLATPSSSFASEDTRLVNIVQRNSNIPEEKLISFSSLVTRCKEDMKIGFRNGQLNISNFLTLVKQKKIRTMEDAENYAREHPRSRTARILLKMTEEIMPDNSETHEVKSFLQEYFTKYTFSFFQRSQLVPIMLNRISNEGAITMDDINHHKSENPNSRTAHILNKHKR